MHLPMLASLADAPLADPAFVYEPKYDGIRAIAEVSAGGGTVTIRSRLGNDKTAQFPEVAAALAAWARRRRDAVVLDGEIVALDTDGQPAGFQYLQGRIHTKSPRRGRRPEPDDVAAAGPTAFILFDVLEAGGQRLYEQPLVERRRVLEALLKTPTAILRLSEQERGDGRALYARALASGWEGLIAKRADSRYRPGKRSPDWRKLKILREQEFVIGGWTESRQSPSQIGALLLGVHEEGRLICVGHAGTGFDQPELARLRARLRPMETSACPFAVQPTSNERPHWVRPELVAQVKFSEWTADGHLRHPVYLGLRDDKAACDVVREGTRLHASTTQRLPVVASNPAAVVRSSGPAGSGTASEGSTRTDVGSGFSRTDLASLVDQLQTLEAARRDGVLRLPGGRTLEVGNLHKVFWPDLMLTKGDLFRYYVQAAPYILPVLADRPLVMKRYPNGIHAANPFYQHRVQDVPAGVRVEQTVIGDETRSQLVGGNLETLLYTCQLAAISQDPWFSRVQAPGEPDQVALDLDPADDVPFSAVLDVARWIHDELEALGVPSFPKTSGASGLHIFIPLAPGTPYEPGRLFCQLVATLVAEKHPRIATVERAVRARGARVYVDYLQNIEGKTLASAYSARASHYAGVSTPLTWQEVHAGVAREDFTIRTVPERLASVGDLWAGLRAAPGIDLRAVVDGKAGGRPG